MFNLLLTGETPAVEAAKTFGEKIVEFANKPTVEAVKFVLVGAVVICALVYIIKNRKSLFR